MPKGPQGQKRPADVIGAAIRVAKIATGEIVEGEVEQKRSKGGIARRKALSAKARHDIAKKAANARWSKKEAEDSN